MGIPGEVPRLYAAPSHGDVWLHHGATPTSAISRCVEREATRIVLNARKVGFDWTTLPEGALVVDVGGGNGSEALRILQSAPKTRVIIEDREETLERVTIPVKRSVPAMIVLCFYL